MKKVVSKKSSLKSIVQKILLCSLILTVLFVLAAYSYAAGDIRLTGQGNQLNPGNGAVVNGSGANGAGAANPPATGQAAIPQSSDLPGAQSGGSSNGAMPFGGGLLGLLGALGLKKGLSGGGSGSSGSNPMLTGLGSSTPSSSSSSSPSSSSSSSSPGGGSTNPFGNSAIGWNTIFAALNGGSSLNKSNPSSSSSSNPSNYYVASNGSAVANDKNQKQAS